MASPETRFARINVQNVENMLDSLVQNAPALAEDLAAEAAREGVDEMKKIINSGGTGNDWKTPSLAKEKPPRGNLKDGGGPARVNTGNMRDLIRARAEQGAQRVSASFGWLDALSAQDQYIRAQEYGFRAGGFRPPTPVKGVFALRDARLYVQKQVLPRLAKKYLRLWIGGR